MTTPLATLRRQLAAAERKSAKLAEARAALPAGSSRARVTTANARWARAAEERDRLARAVAEAEANKGAGVGMAPKRQTGLICPACGRVLSPDSVSHGPGPKGEFLCPGSVQ